MIWPVLALAGFACGFVDAGFSYAYLQREYPHVADDDRVRDTISAGLFFIFGPISLLLSILDGWYRHGWLFPGAKP